MPPARTPPRSASRCRSYPASRCGRQARGRPGLTSASSADSTTPASRVAASRCAVAAEDQQHADDLRTFGQDQRHHHQEQDAIQPQRHAFGLRQLRLHLGNCPGRPLACLGRSAFRGLWPNLPPKSVSICVSSSPVDRFSPGYPGSYLVHFDLVPAGGWGGDKFFGSAIFRQHGLAWPFVRQSTATMGLRAVPVILLFVGFSRAYQAGLLGRTFRRQMTALAVACTRRHHGVVARECVTTERSGV